MPSNTLDSLSKVLVVVMRVVWPLPTLLPRGGPRVAVGRARNVTVMRASARPTLVSLAGWAQVTTVVSRALIMPMIPPRVEMCVLFALFFF
jgi:hypothetical protein